MNSVVSTRGATTHQLEKGDSMGEQKKAGLTEKIEDTMACTAFAEEGEPCPIQTGEKPEAGEKTAAHDSVETTMACSAFAEAGEPCPIKTEKK